MGRYLLYRMNPWSVGECIRTEAPSHEIYPPAKLSERDWDALWEHGGFPEPFLRRDARFTRRWRSLRFEQLSRQDLREVTAVRDLGTVETLMQLLAERSGQQLVYSNLSPEIQASVDSVKRWVDLLVRMHYGFLVRPWFANVAKALRKEPKWFLRLERNRRPGMPRRDLRRVPPAQSRRDVDRRRLRQLRVALLERQDEA